MVTKTSGYFGGGYYVPYVPLDSETIRPTPSGPLKWSKHKAGWGRYQECSDDYQTLADIERQSVWRNAWRIQWVYGAAPPQGEFTLGQAQAMVEAMLTLGADN
jgi:hypothetical protein